MIKLSTQLHGVQKMQKDSLEQTGMSEEDAGYWTPPEELGEMWIKYLSNPQHAVNDSKSNKSNDGEAKPQPAVITPAPANWDEKQMPEIRSAFAHRTKFDLLTDTAEEYMPGDAIVNDPPDKKTKTKKKKHRGTQPPDLDDDDWLMDFDEGVDSEFYDEQVAAGKLMPSFEDSFWQTYGNKLRVFGTVEAVIDMSQFAYSG